MNTNKQNHKTRNSFVNSTMAQPKVQKHAFAPRRINDRWEQQANKAATEVLGGEVDVAKKLSPATPASFSLASSLGQPLPIGIRSTLEQGFGADLQEVRLHSNVYADRSAKMQNAKAFTAGRDIYFSQNAYQPKSEQGQKLLTHEVAHVLQQTGRFDQDGTLVATYIAGAGQIQYECALTGASSSNTFCQLCGFHSSQSGTESLDEFIEEIGIRLNYSIVNGTQTRESLAIAQETIANGFRIKTRKERGFLFDCLKFLYHHEAAAHLITEDHRIKTIAYIEAFDQHLITNNYISGNSDWSTSIIPNNTTLRNFWISGNRYVTQIFLFNMHRPIQAIPNFSTEYIRVNRNRVNSTLVENERYFSALHYIRNEDLNRQEWFSNIRSTADRFNANLIQKALYRARIIRSATIENESVAGAERMPELIEILHEEGNEALEFWQRVDDTDTRLRSLVASINISGISGYERRLLARPFPDNELISSIRETLVARSLSLFALNQDLSHISPGSYFNRRNIFRNRINPKFRQLSALIETHFRNPEERTTTDEEIISIGLLMGMLEHLIAELTNYNYRLDVNESRLYNTADRRIANRFRVAKILNPLSLVTGWTDLETISRNVMLNTQQRVSLLALVSNWDRQEGIQIDRLLTDFPDNRNRRILLETPITVLHIVNFFRTEFQRNLNDALETHLDTNQTNISNDQTDELQQAQSDVQSFLYPQRFHVTNYEFIINLDNPARYLDLVKEHPKTLTFLTNSIEGGVWDGFIFPINIAEEIFLWLFPPIDNLITRIRNIEALNDAIESSEISVDANTLSDQDWLFFFVNNAQELNQAISETNRDLAEFSESETFRSNELLRRLNTHRRLRLAAQITLSLQGYTDITDWSRPNDVLSGLENYSRAVQPETDENLQVAALMLNVASIMKTAFIQETWLGTIVEQRFDIITGLFPFLSLVKSMNEEGRLNEIAGILHDSENLDNLISNASDIQELYAAFDRVRRQGQRRFGINSDGTNSISSLNFASNIETGEANAFIVDNVYFELIDVHNAFVYYPTWGEGTGAELEGEAVDNENNRLGASTRLFTIRINRSERGDGEETTVHARDIELLDELTNVIAYRTFILGLLALGRTIETAVDVTLALSQLIPGLGQAITIGTIISGSAQFIIEDLPTIREELINDPYQMVENLKNEIAERISLEGLIDFLVLAGDNPLENQRRSRRDNVRERSARRARGKLGRLISAVKSIGHRVYSSFDSLKDSMSSAVVNANATISSKPMLAYAIQELPNVLIALETMTDAMRSDIFQNLLEEPVNLSESVSGLLEGLQEMELPSEVIPMDLAVEVIIEFFLNRFGGKGKLLRIFLDGARLLSRISVPIGEALRESSVDPNNIWRQEFLPQVESKFTQLRDGLVQNIYNVINSVIGGLEGAPVSTPGQSELPTIPSGNNMATGDFPELELHTLDTFNTLLNPYSYQFGISSGFPLPTNIREKVESDFGHDFRHVRLHADYNAQQVTSGFHADGLTSGSHIYLQPGVSISSGYGNWLLRHELGHVLQQTGPRPLEHDNHNKPTFGTPGKGVNSDARRENAADNMAKASLNNSQGPISVEEDEAEGLQLSMQSVATRVLGKIADRDLGNTFLTTIRRNRRSATSVPTTVTEEANQFWISLKRELASLPVAKFADNLQQENIRTAINSHIGTTRNTEITNSIRAIAAEALIQERGSGSGAQVSYRLNGRRFRNLLEYYIYARTGIILQSKIRRSGPLRLSSSDPLKVKSVDLGKLGTGTSLYRAMKANTNAHDYSGNGSLNNADWKSIRQWLISIGGEPFILDSDEFRLSQRFIDRFVERRRNAGSVIIPVWTDYINPDSTSDSPGLRIKTHGENLALSGSTVRADRESHHIPQYLLVEYFSNLSSIKIFENGRLPGFEPANSAVLNSFSSSGGNINLSNLRTGSRGDAMPAILLAKETHTRGNLHLGREYSWNHPNDNAEHRTQGNTINNYFYGRLRRGLNLTATSREGAISSYAQSHPKEAKNAIYTAIKRTYEWMYVDRMKPALETALSDIEYPYYRSIAARDHSNEDRVLEREYNPDNYPGPTRTLMDEIQSKNNDIFSAWQ